MQLSIGQPQDNQKEAAMQKAPLERLRTERTPTRICDIWRESKNNNLQKFTQHILDKKKTYRECRTTNVLNLMKLKGFVYVSC